MVRSVSYEFVLTILAGISVAIFGPCKKNLDGDSSMPQFTASKA